MCHYRSDNANFLVDLVDLDHFCEKTKWRPHRKWFVTWKNKHQIRAQEVKRYRINMFILYFDQVLEKKTNKMTARPELVRRTKKTKPDSCSGGLGHSKKTYFYFILTYFDENPKWRQDDVIPEAVNINGAGSRAIPDMPRHFNTSDRNFEKIR